MKIYFGLDGGASSTRAIIIDSNGNTLIKRKLSKGSNLKVYQDFAPKRITELILELCNEISISVDDISAFGFGLAAVSYDPGRELLFKELDRVNIADRSILINDAEAAYKISCQDDVGVLLTVGTGVICIAKNANGDFVMSLIAPPELATLGLKSRVSVALILDSPINGISSVYLSLS